MLTIKRTIKINYTNEKMTIKVILDQTPTLKLIKNLVKDIRSLAKDFRNTMFSYCNRKIY